MFGMQIESHEVHVWRVALDDASNENDLLSLLNEEEKARAQRFHFAHHRTRFIIARATLRKLLSLYLNIPASDIKFSYTEHEKPMLLFPANTHLQFNLSHSKNIAVYAFTYHYPVGIDIEKIKTDYPQAVAERFFNPSEIHALNTLPSTEKLRAFYRLWSRKEAFIKAIGKGIAHLSLSSFAVSAEPTVETLHYDDQTWTLASLHISDDYETAVASSQTIKKLTYWIFSNQEAKFDKVTLL